MIILGVYGSYEIYTRKKYECEHYDHGFFSCHGETLKECRKKRDKWIDRNWGK